MTDETDKARAAVERHWADIDKAVETMWHDLFAETVIELLARQGSVTRGDIAEALEARLAETGTDRITKAKASGGLRALRA